MFRSPIPSKEIKGRMLPDTVSKTRDQIEHSQQLRGSIQTSLQKARERHRIHSERMSRSVEDERYLRGELEKSQNKNKEAREKVNHYTGIIRDTQARDAKINNIIRELQEHITRFEPPPLVTRKPVGREYAATSDPTVTLHGDISDTEYLSDDDGQ